MFKAVICNQCGKMIIPGPGYKYKLVKDSKTYYYCCYTHYRKNGGDNGEPYRTR
jgi:ribosomal protein L24E